MRLYCIPRWFKQCMGRKVAGTKTWEHCFARFLIDPKFLTIFLTIFTIHFLFPSFRHPVEWLVFLLSAGGERPRKQRWDAMREAKVVLQQLLETPNLEAFWLGHLMSFIIFGIVFLMDDFGLIRISCFEIPRSRSIGSVDTIDPFCTSVRRAVRKAHEGASAARGVRRWTWGVFRFSIFYI